MNPSCQKRLQTDIDTFFDGRDPCEWSYTDSASRLFGSCIDAVINESRIPPPSDTFAGLTGNSPALRLFPPANIIPKHTAPGTSHVLRYNNREIHVPGNTTFNILAASTHRNPSYWPTQASKLHSGNDLDDFKPERWVSSCPNESYTVDSGIDLGTDQEECPADKPFTPKKGSFIPYSIGQRECVGKRFAQIEMLAVMAVIFREWSVELVLEKEDSLCAGDRKDAWEKQREMAREHLSSGMEHYMTMQLKKGLIPLRIVKRGSERVL